MDLRKTFDQHGWILLEDFFTKEEINKITEGAKASLNNTGTDLLCNPLLSHLTVLNPKIVELVKQLLPGTLLYIGDSNISYKDTVMSLHKDNPDRFDGNAPDWRSHYDVLRMGIYLQDYRTKSGGLILRDRSHLYPTRWRGKIINVKTKPGDLVVWNLRTTHSGNAKRLKASPSFDLNPYLCKLLPDSLFESAPTERMALFLSYGVEGPHMDRYIQYLKSRKYALTRWRKMEITPEMIAEGKRLGLKILNLVDEAKKMDIEKANEQHVELKY